MLSCLLKRFLPFALTFAFGAAAGGLANLYGARTSSAGWSASGRRHLGAGFGAGARRGCPGARKALAETRPLNILHQPAARYPEGSVMKGLAASALVRVTFGADGRIQQVEPREALPYSLNRAAVDAAWRIRFEPATEDSVAVPVTRDVRILLESE